jgi:hypothetical protein
MISVTRRDFLGQDYVAICSALPPNVQKALATPLPGKPPSLMDTEHVVPLVQSSPSSCGGRALRIFGTALTPRQLADAPHLPS